MQSKNDFRGQHFASAKYLLGLYMFVFACIGVFSMQPIASAVGTTINGQICSGGTHTPAIINTTPPTSDTVTTNSINLSFTVDWVDTLTVKRGSTLLATVTGNNNSGETLNAAIPLNEGTNNLTLTVTGGCPSTPIATSYTLVYLKNAANITRLATNILSPRLSGTFKPIGTHVFVVVVGQTYEATTSSDGTWELPTGTITPDLTDGSYAVRIYMQDAASNTTFDQTYANALVIDTVAPLGAVTSSTTSDSRSPQLDGTVNDSEATVSVAINGSTYAAINNRDGTWTLPAGTITPDLTNGSYPAIITITDKAGNVTTLEFTLAISADDQLGFVLAPNTGYFRINTTNIATKYVYLGILALAVISTLLYVITHRPKKQTT